MTSRPASSKDIKRDLIAYATSLGFGRIGITSADPLPAAEKALSAWLEKGCAGEMEYMEKNWETRSRPQERLPGARSVISLAVSYYSPEPAAEGVGVGRVARYAWGRDYHKVIEKRLDAFLRYVEALAPGTQCKAYTDTGPLMERALAQKAGLGFFGKNTMLITRGLGSWVFLASLLTTLDLPVDAPDDRSCGSCTLCIDACPTQAITEPFHLDARRCIAYLTIESKSEIPADLKPKMGNWLFGCDICQDVCPHNTRLAPTPIAELRPEAGVGAFIPVSKILSLKTEEEFAEAFSGSPLKRAKLQGMIRNARRVEEHQKAEIKN